MKRQNSTLALPKRWPRSQVKILPFISVKWIYKDNKMIFFDNYRLVVVYLTGGNGFFSIERFPDGFFI